MKKMLLAALLFTSLLAGPGWAQDKYPKAVAGRTGVFVQCTHVLHGPRYRIERLAAGTRQWELVHVTDTPPASVDELKDRLQMLALKHSSLAIPSDSTMHWLWKHYQRASTTDSLYGYGAHPLLLEALNLGYLDEQVQPGTRYDYRVMPLGEATEKLLQAAKAISIPGALQPFGARLVRSEATGRSVRMIWYVSKPTAALGGVRVFRNVFAQTKPEEVPVDFGFRRGKKDSLLIEMTDLHVQKHITYQYVVVPTDFLGNEGTYSDTLTITNLRPYDDLPAIRSVFGNSAEAQQAVRLSWRLSGSRGLREIKILRSNSFEGPYAQIGSALPTDTTFLDRRVTPVQVYYYQLILNGTYDQSPASVKFPGMLKASRPAFLAPRKFEMTQTKDELRFTWRRNEPDTRGYYLYRGNSVRGALQQFGNIILSTDSLVTYAIKTADLPPAPVYSFVVRAVNTSYNLSPPSDTLFTSPVGPSKLPTPLDVVALVMPTRNKAAQLVWADMTRAEASIKGYAIFRKSETEKDFRELYRQPTEEMARNSYIDSTVALGQQYEYSVLAYGLNGLESARSATAAFQIALPPALPPRGLRVFPIDKGIYLSWDEPVMKDLSKYNVYRYRSGSKPVLLTSVLPGTTTFTDAKPGAGLHYYAITTVNASGQESIPSEAIGIHP
jgi:hypothetical protein